MHANSGKYDQVWFVEGTGSTSRARSHGETQTRGEEEAVGRDAGEAVSIYGIKPKLRSDCIYKKKKLKTGDHLSF